MTVFGPLYTPSGSAQGALDALLAALRARHGEAIDAVLFYGSCLRSGELLDGLVDLYVIVRDYRAAHAGTLEALANRVLAPNVYYLQAASAAGTVRSKYGVWSLVDLQRAVSPAWFESYGWGRLCQPVAVVYHRDAQSLERVRAGLRRAAITFLDRTLPALPASAPLPELWAQALALSYATELRVEGGGRAATLVEANRAFFEAATREVRAALRWPLELDGVRVRSQVPQAARRRARIAWRLRRVQGKLLSIARLLKALATFEGGFDYIAWKLERHSGHRIEIPERVRRHPLLFVWALLWRLWRDGVLR